MADDHVLNSPMSENVPKAVPAVGQDSAARPVWIRVRQALILLGALVLMFIGQLQIFRDPHDKPTSTSYVLISLGLVIFFAAASGVASDEGTSVAVPVLGTLHIRWRWLAASLGLAAFAAWRTTGSEAYLGEYLLIWGLSLVTLVISVSPREGEPSPPDDQPFHRREYILLAALLLAALLIRGINLQTEPYILDNDEANFAAPGGDARLQNFLVNPFQIGFQNHPYFHSVLIGLSTAVFGETIAAARVPSMLMGSLTILAIYLLGRELKGRLVGLIAALFALGWSFQIQFSRLALNQPGDPLFGALAFYFLLRGLRRGSAVDYMVSGIALGISQLFYTTGRQLPIVMLAYLIFLLWRDRAAVKRQWRLILLIPMAAFTTLLPQHFYLLYNHSELVGHFYPNILLGGQLQEVISAGASVGDYLLRQVKDSFLALFATADRGGWYGSSSNLLGPFGGPLILLGVVVSLVILWKQPRWSLPLGWGLAAIVVGATLATDPPHYQRYVSGVPAISLLVALGITTIATGFARVLQRPGLRQQMALGLGAVLCVANLAFYTGVYVPERNYLTVRQNWVANRVGAEVAANAGRNIVLFSTPESGVEKVPIVDFLGKGIAYSVVTDDLDKFLADFDASQPYTFIVALPRDAELRILEQRIPGGKIQEVDLDQDRKPAFYVYRSP